MKDVLIIGAGLSGLMAARALEENGASVTIVDKGRSVGGRMATRRIASGLADHGAQFFTVRDSAFQAYVDHWLADGLVYEWSRGWSDGSLKPTPNDGHPRYVTRGGMNALAKHLASGLKDVQVDTRIITLETDGHSWAARAENEAIFISRALLLTAPAPQALELLEANHIPLDPEDHAELARIQYGPCLCGMFLVEGEVDLPEPGALQDFNQPFYWMADNQRKGISEARIITVHAGASYSREHWDDDDDTVLKALQKALEARLKGQVVEGQLKRWRYSVPLTTYPHDCFRAKAPSGLVLAGDAFGGRGRVEGAALSGLAAAKALWDYLNKK